MLREAILMRHSRCRELRRQSVSSDLILSKLLLVAVSLLSRIRVLEFSVSKGTLDLVRTLVLTQNVSSDSER